MEDNTLKLHDLLSQFPPAMQGAMSTQPFFDDIDAFWKAVYQGPHLSMRMKELIMIAFHGASSALNKEALSRHIDRALLAGATESEILEVLATIIPLANHPLYVAIPVLQEELRRVGRDEDAELPPMSEAVSAIRDDFVRRRGYWTPMRDTIGCLMPDYFKHFINVCMTPWENGSLEPLERELLYIAIDTSVTHTYEPGIRMHIQNALRYGATRGQILEVFQLAALLGTEGYVLAMRELAGRPAQNDSVRA